MPQSVYDLQRMFKRSNASMTGVFLFLTLILVTVTSAHDFSTSYSKLQVDGSVVRVELTINLLDLHGVPNVDTNEDRKISSDEFEKAIPHIFEAIRSNFKVRAPDIPSESFLDNYGYRTGDIARFDIVYRFKHAVSQLRVISTLDNITQPNHRHLLQIGEGDEARHNLLSTEEPEVAIDYAIGIPLWVTILEFVELGMTHIFSGYDHLAFLVCLLLATTTTSSLVKIVTSFTAGHSLTLVLATFGIVALPSRLIESLIALSIAYVAMEIFTGYILFKRWKITFLFGLVHGFGFSNVLQDMELTHQTLAVALFSFNAGVEVGQVLFVCALIPAIFYLGRSRWKQKIVAVLSVVIMSLAFYWFVQRALLA